MFLQGVWFIIAGLLLLLGHTAALADSYLRVQKKGVTYYYFSDREFPRARRAELDPAACRRVLLTPGRGPALWEGETFSPGPLPPPALPGRADTAPLVTPPGAQVQIWASARYFMGLLTKLGYRNPLPSPASYSGPDGVERRLSAPQLPEPAPLAVEESEHFLPKAIQPRTAWSQIPLTYGGASQLLYCFPVAGPYSFRDSFGDYRSGGRLHRAVDIFAPEGTPVYAVTAGVIRTLTVYRGGGITLIMQGRDGRGYGYMHLLGYAPGIAEGKPVQPGELLGYVGRTGLLTSPAHLHFQVYADHGLGSDHLLNPYPLLVQLCQGRGVTDSYQHHLASLAEPQTSANQIQVYRRRIPTVNLDRSSRRNGKDPSVLVIRNF